MLLTGFLSCLARGIGEYQVNLGMELGRDVSAASYLREHLGELTAGGDSEGVLAALETGIALERCQLGRATRSWRRVVAVAERLGRETRRAGLPMQRVASRIDRVRDAMDQVLFDGRLPPDIATLAARTAAKMSGLLLKRAILAYWDAASPEQPACDFQMPA